MAPEAAGSSPVTHPIEIIESRIRFRRLRLCGCHRSPFRLSWVLPSFQWTLGSNTTTRFLLPPLPRYGAEGRGDGEAEPIRPNPGPLQEGEGIMRSPDAVLIFRCGIKQVDSLSHFWANSSEMRKKRERNDVPIVMRSGPRGRRSLVPLLDLP